MGTHYTMPKVSRKLTPYNLYVYLPLWFIQNTWYELIWDVVNVAFPYQQEALKCLLFDMSLGVPITHQCQFILIFSKLKIPFVYVLKCQEKI